MSVQPRVLVSNSTGKAGAPVSRALKAAGFDVYGTTRGGKSLETMKADGITSTVCNYTDKGQLIKAFASTGAKLFFLITDYEAAAKSNKAIEEQQGRNQIDAAKVAGVEFVIFLSVADCDIVDDKLHFCKSKLTIENYLKASGLKFAILRPCGFFENFNDARHFNPLKKGHLKAISPCRNKMIATYDMGKAAAIMFNNQDVWHGKTLDCCGWEGDLKDAALALEKVSGTKTTYGNAVPYFIRYLFLGEIHNLFLYIEKNNWSSSVAAFKEVVPDAMGAEEWFASLGQFADGEKFITEMKASSTAELMEEIVRKTEVLKAKRKLTERLQQDAG